MPRRRILLTVAAVGTAALSLLSMALLAAWSPGAKSINAKGIRGIALPHRLRNSAEHDNALRRVGNPYILEIEFGTGALLYYGARHTTDPHDPQIGDIERRWTEFKPTIALCEGRSRGYFVGGLLEPLLGLPEPAMVHKLARRDDVPIHSLEPMYEDEVATLLEKWSPEQVALYFTLRVYMNEAQGSANDRLALDLLRKRTDVAGLSGVLSSVEDMDRAWQRHFADQEDWRTLLSEPPDSFLAHIGRDSNRIRGEHMSRILIDLVQRGERVMAVVGSGHVIRQEWSIRAILGAPPAPDQPDTARIE
jgi:hypothetical protein